jgi:hypothetical protein
MTDSAVAGYTFFCGSQPVEFEREEVPEIVPKRGVTAEIAGSVYSLVLRW